MKICLEGAVNQWWGEREVDKFVLLYLHDILCIGQALLESLAKSEGNRYKWRRYILGTYLGIICPSVMFCLLGW